MDESFAVARGKDDVLVPFDRTAGCLQCAARYELIKRQLLQPGSALQEILLGGVYAPPNAHFEASADLISSLGGSLPASCTEKSARLLGTS